MSTKIPRVPAAAALNLPELSETAKRKLAIKWVILVNRLGLTGDHLNWPRTRKIKLVSSAPPPIQPVTDRSPIMFRRGHSKAAQHQVVIASPYAPPDMIGVSESVNLAKD